MKTFALIIIFLNTAPLISQTFPFITDYGSLAGSGANTIPYTKIEKEERKLIKVIKSFTISYSQRIFYLEKIASEIKQKIDNEMDEATNRYNKLVTRNNSMSSINYFKKEKNTKILNIINKMLINIQRGLSSQHSDNVLSGEKLNLYQNAMASFFEIHELMDTVEDKVSQSYLLDFITQRK